MIKKVSLVLALLLTVMVFSQEEIKSVEVNYTGVIDMDVEKVLARVPSQYRAQVEPMLKSELKDGITLTYTLKTNGKKSVYQLDEKINNAQSSGGMIAQQIRSADKEPMYKDLEKMVYKKVVTVPGYKTFLIADSLSNYQWNITREKSKVLNFEVRKATGVINDTIPVTAWFTTKVPMKDGPSNICGLPGLVLKASFESNGAKITLTANNVSTKEEEINITEPTNGEVVTEKELEVEMKAFAEKMKAMMGNGVDTE